MSSQPSPEGANFDVHRPWLQLFGKVALGSYLLGAVMLVFTYAGGIFLALGTVFLLAWCAALLFESPVPVQTKDPRTS